MTKFKYSEKVILKANDKEFSIISATYNAGNNKANYVLSNGMKVCDSDLLKLTEKKQPKTKPKIKSVSVLSDSNKKANNKAVTKK